MWRNHVTVAEGQLEANGWTCYISSLQVHSRYFCLEERSLDFFFTDFLGTFGIFCVLW